MFEIFILLFVLFIILLLISKLWPKCLINSHGKAVLITGCDSGFGYQTAHRLNAMGFKVYATVLNNDSPGAQELQTNAVFADKMIILQMNVTNDSQVIKVYEEVKNDLNNSGQELWALINNAGIVTVGLLDWGTLHTYHQLFEVNVFGTVRVTRVFLPLIQASKGRIININSMSGRLPTLYFEIYSMTKHSLLAFTDILRREQANYNVTVCSIEPGYFKTNVTNIERLTEDMDSLWNESTSNVQQFYGSPDTKKRNFIKMMGRLSAEENIDICVDDIIDSVVNSRPKIIYRPMSLVFKITMAILLNLPTIVCDRIMALNT